jgi:TetR/AcrR family transcriptional regulator, upper aerobic nicotinate degradation pathway regulator
MHAILGFDSASTARVRMPKKGSIKHASLEGAMPLRRGRPPGRVPTRENILQAAIDHFAQHGFAGGRIDRISRAANSTDRMIYYYFTSKEGLFVEVLESVYRDLGAAESRLDLRGSASEDCLRRIFRFTWDYYRQHPEMLSLLNNENLHRGRHLAVSKRVKRLSFPLLAILSDTLQRGVSEGRFRRGISARTLYIAICALGYFYLSNRYTLSAFLGADLMNERALRKWRMLAEDMLLRYVCRPQQRGD